MYHSKLELGQMVACIVSSVNKTFFFSNVLDSTKFGLNYKISLLVHIYWITLQATSSLVLNLP